MLPFHLFFSAKIPISSNLSVHFLSLRFIEFCILRMFNAVSQVMTLALSNPRIPESQELFPGLAVEQVMLLNNFDKCYCHLNTFHIVRKQLCELWSKNVYIYDPLSARVHPQPIIITAQGEYVNNNQIITTQPFILTSEHKTQLDIYH